MIAKQHTADEPSDGRQNDRRAVDLSASSVTDQPENGQDQGNGIEHPQVYQLVARPKRFIVILIDPIQDQGHRHNDAEKIQTRGNHGGNP